MVRAIPGLPQRVKIAGLNFGGARDGSSGIFTPVGAMENELGNLWLCRLDTPVYRTCE